jgi:hypothetical protein
MGLTLMSMRKKDETASAQVVSKRVAFDRVRLIHEDLDKLAADATDRTQSIATKASFLAVSAGVVIAALTAQVWSELVVVGVISMALATVGLLCAAVALRPARRPGTSGRSLADRFLDSTASVQQIEPVLVREKANHLAGREDDLRARSYWVWAGFVALGGAAILLAIVFSTELLGA